MPKEEAQPTVQISARVPVEARAKVERMAADLSISLSEAIRRLVQRATAADLATPKEDNHGAGNGTG